MSEKNWTDYVNGSDGEEEKMAYYRHKKEVIEREIGVASLFHLRFAGRGERADRLLGPRLRLLSEGLGDAERNRDVNLVRVHLDDGRHVAADFVEELDHAVVQLEQAHTGDAAVGDDGFQDAVRASFVEKHAVM